MLAQRRVDFALIPQSEEHAFGSLVDTVCENALHVIQPPLANT